MVLGSIGRKVDLLSSVTSASLLSLEVAFLLLQLLTYPSLGHGNLELNSVKSTQEAFKNVRWYELGKIY